MQKIISDDQARRVPFWVIRELGKKVRLSKPYKDSTGRVYPAGSTGRLESIQSGRRSAFATVVLDADPIESEENFQFGDLRPL